MAGGHQDRGTARRAAGQCCAGCTFARGCSRRSTSETDTTTQAGRINGGGDSAGGVTMKPAQQQPGKPDVTTADTTEKTPPNPGLDQLAGMAAAADGAA